MSLFFLNDSATTELYSLSLHDALPILQVRRVEERLAPRARFGRLLRRAGHDLGRIARARDDIRRARVFARSEEHTSELQSPMYLVCRLLLEKKNGPALDRKDNRDRKGA